MMTTYRFAFVLVAALAAANVGCSDSPATLTSPSAGGGSLALTAGQMSGAWALTSLQVAGQAPQPVPGGAAYSLTFADGRFSARADCNTCTGSYVLSGTSVTLGPNIACTRAACPTMAFEAAYTKVLSGEAEVVLTGNTLVLTSARGVASFAR